MPRAMDGKMKGNGMPKRKTGQENGTFLSNAGQRSIGERIAETFVENNLRLWPVETALFCDTGRGQYIMLLSGDS